MSTDSVPRTEDTLVLSLGLDSSPQSQGRENMITDSQRIPLQLMGPLKKIL